MTRASAVRFSSRQVRVLIQIADRFHPNLGRSAGELESTIRLVIEGRLAPTPALVHYFQLRPARNGGYECLIP